VSKRSGSVFARIRGRCSGAGGAAAAQQFSTAARKPRLEHERLVDGAHAASARVTSVRAGVCRWGEGAGGMGADGGGAGAHGQVPALGGPSGWRPAGNLPSWARGGLQPTRPPGVVMRPSPLHLQTNGPGHGKTLGPHPAGERTRAPLHPCHRRCITITTTSPSVCPVRLHMIMWIDNVYLKGLGLLNAWLLIRGCHSCDSAGTCRVTPDDQALIRSRGPYFLASPETDFVCRRRKCRP